MTDPVERLNTGLKLLDSKLHMAVALGLRDMLTETRNEIVSLRSRLSDIESQNRVMWDVANDREARLAEAERDAARYRFIRRWARRLDIVGYCLSSENMEVRIDEAMSTADAPAAAMRETER